MSQLFNKQTLQGAVVKSLVKDIPIPIFNSIKKGDYMVTGNNYLYGCNLIKCIVSGRIGYTGVYKNISHFDLGENNPQLTTSFESDNLSYDSTIHENLGKLLRVIRDINKIDLMPFYNCFSSRYNPNLTISMDEDTYRVINHQDSSKKVYQIPIKFNTKYTIAIDCDSQVFISPAIISHYKLIPSFTSAKKSLTDELNEVNPIKVYDSLSFNMPITFEVTNTYEPTAQMWQNYERNLCLLIQLPSTNNSSIVVLEGEYQNDDRKKIINKEDFNEVPQEELNNILLGNLSLMWINDHQSYPFSDRLIEYLLENVITDRDFIGQNIKNVQEALGVTINSQWSNELRYKLFNTYFNNLQLGRFNRFDITGFVDKDIEKMLRGM